jgi:DNA-binding response OmpR family regulator
MARILVIDDDSNMRCLVARILARASHEVIEAANGKKGMEQFATYRPEVVVTDLLMPEQEGIETIRELRRIAPSLRIVAMSGGGTDNDLIFLGMAKALGADAVLAKPFRADELIRAVQ